MILYIEPLGLAFEIEAQSEVDVEGEFISTSSVSGSDLTISGEIEISPRNKLTLYLYPGATVWKNGVKQTSL